LGCGTGWFAEKLSHFGRVTGIDLSASAISAAQKRYPGIEFIAGNLFDMKLPRETFDVVVCQEVIAHVPDQPALLDRIAEVMKPGGYLVITTVNKFVIDRVDCGPDPREHIKQWLTMNEFKRLLRRRFRVLRTTTVLPMGDRGILRLLNASKIEALLNHLLGAKIIETLKERTGFGYTMIALAQKQ
jgi:2-polyprenyl-3-methyl-5-hydroxy-6-metoxy-1,4-benzoquinol methylase